MAITEPILLALLASACFGLALVMTQFGLRYVQAAMGAAVVAIDVDAGRLELAAAHGATHTINARECADARSAVRAFAKQSGRRGIGLPGLCQSGWNFRYLPPAQNVLQQACADLVARREIRHTNIGFIAAVPGGGSLVAAVKAGTIQAFEFATPADDVSQLFVGADNPGTVGVRYMHFPGWHQQFLITYMLINKQVWNGLSPAQQALVQSVGRDHVVSSYGENLRQQGPALRTILDANKGDADPRNDMVLVQWPERDQERLRAATMEFLEARADDATLPYADRQAYVTILDQLRKFVRANDLYWDVRAVETQTRFKGWYDWNGEPWGEPEDHAPCHHD